jgi:hypothetical protein
MGAALSLTFLRPWFAVLLLAGAVPVLAEEPALPCLPGTAAACAGCHAQDLAERFPAHRARPCTPYCLTCHFKDGKEVKDQHHSVGTALRKKLTDPRLVTEGDRLGCATCHDLSTPRYDKVRWRAESLFDRMFRSQDRYRTYLLVYRNDKGQLCLACH